MIPTLIPDLVAIQAKVAPQRPALSDGGVTVSYSELWHHVNAAANALLAASLQPDDRVAVYLEKRRETVAAYFGTALAGGVFVPINPVLRDDQVLHVMRDCRAKFMVTSAARLEALDHTLAQAPDLSHVLVVAGGNATTAREGLSIEAWPAVDRTALPARPHRRIDIDMAAILYTSGSTGRPKGVVLSHRNLVAGALSVNQYLCNTPEDRILAALPFSFDAGLSQLTTGFAAGATVVLINYFTARDLVGACAEQGITALTGVPPLWNQLVQQVWPADAAQNLRYFANTGGHLTRPTLQKLRSIFPRAKPFLMYGLTEAFRSTYLDPSEVDRRPDSIGKAIPNAEILVVDRAGRLCGPGEEGELVHRGALVAMGYWNDRERTAERFRPAPGRPGELPLEERAVWSGDTVRIDEEGFIYYVGRTDGMIKSSGYRISPTEIEEIVLAMEGIEEAVAVGVPHPDLGQAIIVVVTLAPARAFDQAAILGQCRAKLPLFMVPAQIVERRALPQTSSGKIDRMVLARELSSLYQERGTA
jgi:acyl-CoA ligase (AMP-forming) (exosortase A-associated)